MVKHEIDKETLRHDAFRETMFGALGYVLKYQKWFIAGGIALVLLAGTIFGGGIYLDYHRLKMTEVYYEAEKLLQETGTEDKTKLEKARAALEGYVKANPDSVHTPIAWMHIAELAWRQKDLDRAEQAFKAALNHRESTDTTSALARIGLAKLLENRGDYAGSSGLYRDLDEKQFGELKAFHLGRVALQQKNMEEAHRQFQTASEFHPVGVIKQWAMDVLSFQPKN